LDISDSAIYRWETDRARPTAANLKALCELLELPLKATRAMAAA
jgi:hypothetical protein